MITLAEKPLTLEQKINHRQTIKAKIDALNSEVSTLKKELDACDANILEDMDELGVKRTGTQTANVIVTESVIANADSARWEEIFYWIAANDAWDLVRKQINSGPFRSYLESGQEIPGLSPYTKRNIQVRKA